MPREALPQCHLFQNQGQIVYKVSLKIAKYNEYIAALILKLYSTACPGSLDTFYIVSYFIKWVKTFWAYSMCIDSKLFNTSKVKINGNNEWIYNYKPQNMQTRTNCP